MASKDDRGTLNRFPASKMLYYNAKGFSNLAEWRRNVSQHLYVTLGDIADVITTKEVPEAWINGFEYRREDYNTLERNFIDCDALTQKRVVIAMSIHANKQEEWKSSRSKLIASILDCITTESIRRLRDVSEEDLDAAVAAKDVIKVLNLIESSHTFKGGLTHSFHDKEMARAEWVNFKLLTSEALAPYYKRYCELLKKLDAMTIKDMDQSRLVYKFITPLTIQ